MKFPEHFRYCTPYIPPHHTGDPFGYFRIPIGEIIFFVMASTDENWDHVSVSSVFGTPNWNDMCHIKGLFWDPEETVVQFHPPKSEYVNIAENCLHLWRWRGGEFPRPPKHLV